MKPITDIGHRNLKTELKELKSVKRPNVIEAISVAREHGDLSENAEYHAAKEEQVFIETRIHELESVLCEVKIIDISTIKSKVIVFGATVRLLNDDTEEKISYKIVGETESDLAKKLISISSPLAKALIGKSKGDSIEVPAPGGTKYYEVLSFKFVA